MNDPKHHQDNIYKGILFGILAFFCFSAMNGSGKYLSDTLHPFEIGFWRCVIAIIPFALYALLKRSQNLLKVKKPWTLFFRALIGNLALVLTFAAVKYLPLSNATLLFMTTALITPVMAVFFLKEHIGIHRWGAICVGFIGVIIITNPTAAQIPENQYLLGVALAISASIAYSAIHIFLRHLREENSFTVTLYFIFSGIILLGITMPFIAQPIETRGQIIALAIVGISGALAQLFLALAFKFAPASSISPFNMTGLLWATVFDILIWNYTPGLPIITGAFIIISSTLYIIHRERLAKDESKTP